MPRGIIISTLSDIASTSGVEWSTLILATLDISPMSGPGSMDAQRKLRQTYCAGLSHKQQGLTLVFRFLVVEGGYNHVLLPHLHSLFEKYADPGVEWVLEGVDGESLVKRPKQSVPRTNLNMITQVNRHD